MRSRDIFERPSRAVKPRKPIGLVAVLSAILPGTGHVLLGRGALGLGLLAAALLAIPASIAARTLAPELFAPLAWLVGRLGVVAAIFAVADAPLTAREPRWRPRSAAQLPPREAAAWNYAFYGVGLAKMKETGSAWIAILAGGAAHVGLVLFLPSPWTFVAEIVPALLAFWAYRQAEEINSQRTALHADDDEDPMARPKARPVAPMPAWVVPVQAFMATALVASGLIVWIAHTHWLSNRAIDRSFAVVQEPFYQNPAYGLQLEMRAPGWTFREDEPGLFFDALHIGEKSRFQIRLAPRIPGLDGQGPAEELFLESLSDSGLRVLSVDSEPADVRGLPAYRLHAVATRNGVGRDVAGLVYESGFRRYLLHMEWQQDHAGFGVAEWDFVLNGLTIEDTRLGTSVVAR